MALTKIRKLTISIAVPQLAGIIGSVFTVPAIPTWYQQLERPDWSPPAGIFAPVWITLYALMGIAAFLVWDKGLKTPGIRPALGMFLIQLVLNVLWTYLFFGLENPGLAFAEIILLWLAILSTVLAFFKISRTAGWLLVPYLAWVGFAGFLNYTIWLLNQ